MKKHKILISLIISILIFTFFISNISKGYSLELVLSSDKKEVNIGDVVNITLSLSRGMQAADFTINYDSNLLEFTSASIGNNFYSTKEPGKIICSWFDSKDTSEFKFSFIAKEGGVANFTTTTENFYDGDLKSASNYNEGNLKVKLLSSNNNSFIVNNGDENFIIITTNDKEQSNSDNNLIQIPNSNTQTNTENNETTKSSTTTNSTQNNQYQNNITIGNTQNNSQSAKSSNENLPQTGDNTFVFFIVGIIFVLIAVISKKKISLLKDI